MWYVISVYTRYTNTIIYSKKNDAVGAFEKLTSNDECLYAHYADEYGIIANFYVRDGEE